MVLAGTALLVGFVLCFAYDVLTLQLTLSDLFVHKQCQQFGLTSNKVASD
jgi:hypothetical protein